MAIKGRLSPPENPEQKGNMESISAQKKPKKPMHPNWARPRNEKGHFFNPNKPPEPEVVLSLADHCFPKQLAFLEDPAPFVTASCSRRAGKSSACARDLLYTAHTNPQRVCGYVTLTSRMAKRIIWRELRDLDKKWKLDSKFNEVELAVYLKNKSIIYLGGCQTESEMDKFLGVPLKLFYLDEIQSFRSHVAEFIDRVIAPSLMDHDGKLKLIGTPALLKSGYFWNAINNNEYSHHSWTFWDNPFIELTSKKTHQQLLDRELKRRGIAITDPSIRREWFGEWINDDASRVFVYDTVANHFDTAPACTDHVISVDLGFKDADAIAVIGWRKHERTAYLLEELVVTKQGVTELAAEITALVNKYKPLKVVMDTGGLGLKIAEELRRRFSLPIEAAAKSRKHEYIELLNDALRTKSFMAKRDSKFASDTFVVEWDHNRSTPDRRVIKDEPHSDICDAVLYGFREAMHWLEDAAPVARKMTSWADWSQKNALENLEKQIEKQSEQHAAYEAECRAYEDEMDTAKRILNQRRNR